MPALDSNAIIGETRQPNPPSGPAYIYRGNGKWDLYVQGQSVDLNQYRTNNAQDVIDAAQNAAIDSKAAAAHNHPISDVTGLQAALDGKQASGSYAATSHTHAIADTTGLQAALDGKQASGSYAATSHTHAIADVTGLQAALDGKAETTATAPNATEWAGAAKTVSTGTPIGGADGDIHFQYE